jgi:hypothetical protein
MHFSIYFTKTQQGTSYKEIGQPNMDMQGIWYHVKNDQEIIFIKIITRHDIGIRRYASNTKGACQYVLSLHLVSYSTYKTWVCLIRWTTLVLAKNFTFSILQTYTIRGLIVFLLLTSTSHCRRPLRWCLLDWRPLLPQILRIRWPLAEPPLPNHGPIPPPALLRPSCRRWPLGRPVTSRRALCCVCWEGW